MFQVKLLNIVSIDEQINVFKKAFNNNENFYSIKEKWINKHFENPIQVSYIFGVYDKSKLVSINAFLVGEYEYEERIYKVVQSCESGTLPEYQGKGIWNIIIKYAMEYFKEQTDVDFMIGFPNFNNSYPGFLKRGWTKVIDMENYILCCNGEEFFYSLTNRRMKILPKILELQQLKCKLLSSNFILKNKKEMENNIENKKIFSLVKSDSFLSWKKKYKNLEEIVIEEKEKKIIIIYGNEKYKDSNILKIYDIEYKNISNFKEKELYLAKGIKKIVKNNKNIAFIRVWTTKYSELSLLLKKLYFIKVRHQNPFIIYLLKESNYLKENIFVEKKWKENSFLDLD